MTARGVGVLTRFMVIREGVMEKCQEGLGEFSSHTTFKMGDGSKTRFWPSRKLFRICIVLLAL